MKNNPVLLEGKYIINDLSNDIKENIKIIVIRESNKNNEDT